MTDFNFHPLLVHFPIALLSLYSILEMIQVKRVTSLQYWFYIKALLVTVGVSMAIPTILAGKLIEEQFRDQDRLVELHSHVAYITIALYLVLATIYSINWTLKIPSVVKLPKIIKPYLNYVDFFSKPVFLFILALLGLVFLMTTGALGGLIAFGPNVDPMTQLLYQFLKSLQLI